MDLENTTRIYEEPAVNQVLKRLDRTPERGECRRRLAEIWRLSVQASVILCQMAGVAPSPALWWQQQQQSVPGCSRGRCHSPLSWPKVKPVSLTAPLQPEMQPYYPWQVLNLKTSPGIWEASQKRQDAMKLWFHILMWNSEVTIRLKSSGKKRRTFHMWMEQHYKHNFDSYEYWLYSRNLNIKTQTTPPSHLSQKERKVKNQLPVSQKTVAALVTRDIPLRSILCSPLNTLWPSTNSHLLNPQLDPSLGTQHELQHLYGLPTAIFCRSRDKIIDFSITSKSPAMISWVYISDFSTAVYQKTVQAFSFQSLNL